MLIERRAKAREQRIVPENIARFMGECAEDATLNLKPVSGLAHTFEPGRTPNVLKKQERSDDWRLPQLAARYPRISTDRKTAESNNLEWVTPGHPLFEALRRNELDCARDAFACGACFHSVSHEEPARIDIYRARAVDGLGRTIHERLFAVELSADGEMRLRDPQFLRDVSPTVAPDSLPAVASLPEATSWLMENALTAFIEEIRKERTTEIERIAEHVQLSLTEVLHRADQEIGRAAEDVEKGKPGAEGRLAQAETRHAETLARRDRRREELGRERAVTLQDVSRLASAVILPHSQPDMAEVRRLRPNTETGNDCDARGH